MVNHDPNKGKEFAATKSMAGMLDFDSSWLKQNMGELFIEGTHFHKLGYRTIRWDAPMVLNRIYNINNEAAHREFIEKRIEYLNSPKCA